MIFKLYLGSFGLQIRNLHKILHILVGSNPFFDKIQKILKFLKNSKIHHFHVIWYRKNSQKIKKENVFFGGGVFWYQIAWTWWIFDNFIWILMIKKSFQKIDLNEPEYVENYGDQFSAVQMIFYIAKKSIFINFLKNKKIVFFLFFI